MRCNEKEGVSALFVDESSEYTVVGCGGCKNHSKVSYEELDSNLPYYCSFCGNEICYRPWYSW